MYYMDESPKKKAKRKKKFKNLNNTFVIKKYKIT